MSNRLSSNDSDIEIDTTDRTLLSTTIPLETFHHRHHLPNVSSLPDSRVKSATFTRASLHHSSATSLQDPVLFTPSANMQQKVHHITAMSRKHHQDILNELLIGSHKGLSSSSSNTSRSHTPISCLPKSHVYCISLPQTLQGSDPSRLESYPPYSSQPFDTYREFPPQYSHHHLPPIDDLNVLSLTQTQPEPRQQIHSFIHHQTHPFNVATSFSSHQQTPKSVNSVPLRNGFRLYVAGLRTDIAAQQVVKNIQSLLTLPCVGLQPRDIVGFKPFYQTRRKKRKKKNTPGRLLRGDGILTLRSAKATDLVLIQLDGFCIPSLSALSQQTQTYAPISVSMCDTTSFTTPTGLRHMAKRANNPKERFPQVPYEVVDPKQNQYLQT